MLAHVGTLNSARSAFTFQSAFIWAIALVVLWNSFLGWPWANLGCCLRKHTNTDVHKGMLHQTLVAGKNIDVSIQTLLESPQFRHGRRGNDMNCMPVLVFYTSIQAFTLITTNVSKWGAKWPAFLGANAWSDNIEGWILSHFTLARCVRTNSCAAYVLAFTGKSNIKCINVPYKFLHWRFSSLLNSENCLHLTM